MHKGITKHNEAHNIITQTHKHIKHRQQEHTSINTQRDTTHKTSLEQQHYTTHRTTQQRKHNKQQHRKTSNTNTNDKTRHNKHT